MQVFANAVIQELVESRVRSGLEMSGISLRIPRPRFCDFTFSLSRWFCKIVRFSLILQKRYWLSRQRKVFFGFSCTCNYLPSWPQSKSNLKHFKSHIPSPCGPNSFSPWQQFPRSPWQISGAMATIRKESAPWASRWYLSIRTPAV